MVGRGPGTVSAVALLAVLCAVAVSPVLAQDADSLPDVADRYELAVLAPPIPRTVRFAEASASGSSVLSGRKNKGATAYRDLAAALLGLWKSGRKLPQFAPEA